ncbi:hypothetical protein BDGGKGIB_02182 [Nodularia sphaerocarpa UHCC 0038]|nr:hypothetical protein BDGGKGIB_02182 [Nodularia sphaerocarpa UHCC 0038]
MSNPQPNPKQPANKKVNPTTNNDKKRPLNNGKPDKTGH